MLSCKPRCKLRYRLLNSKQTRDSHHCLDRCSVIGLPSPIQIAALVQHKPNTPLRYKDGSSQVAQTLFGPPNTPLPARPFQEVYRSLPFIRGRGPDKQTAAEYAS